MPGPAANPPHPADADDDRALDTEAQIPRPARATIGGNAKVIWFPITVLAVSIICTVLLSLYAFAAILSQHPQIGGWFLDASRTNFLIGIFSQIYGRLKVFLFIIIVDHLRWALAQRTKGVSMATFFELSGSTGAFALSLLSVGSGINRLWGFVRALLFVINIFWGSILKLHLNFEYYFRPDRPIASVFAGLPLPLDINVLYVHSLDVATVCIYFAHWTASLLSVYQFAVALPGSACTSSCREVFLPGSIDIPRVQGPWLNETLLQGGSFDNNSTDVNAAVQLPNTPGIAIKFEPTDVVFDRSTDCRIYGKENNDGLQVCAKNVGNSVEFGWAACPTPNFIVGTCYSNTTWSSGQNPLDASLLMTTSQQFSTTAYSARDLSILNVELTSESRVVPVEASTYWQIWGRVFIPHRNSSSFDNSSIASLIGSLTWLLRLEHDLYSSDKNTPVTYLQNFLAVPLQFTVSCIQYANYTSGDPAGTWAMPDEFKTQAIFGTSGNRIYGPPGPTISFIAVAVATDLIFAAMILWMLVQGRPLRATPPINDLDLISLADEDQENGYPRLREIAQHTQDQEKGWWERLEPVRRLRLALLKRPGGDSIVVREPLDRRSEATPFLLQDFNAAEGEASERTTDSKAPAAFTESSTAVSETGQQRPTNTAITKGGLVAPAGRAAPVPRGDRQRHSWAGAYTPLDLGHFRL